MSGCAKRSLVDAHFAGRIRPADERSFREHLPGCEDCQAYYQQHLVLSGLDPQALDAKDRLARGLGVRTGRRTHPWRLWVPIGATVLALALVLMLGPWTSQPDPDEFAVRGQPQASFQVFRLAPGGEPTPAPEEIGARDELAFAYLNPAGKRWLMIFGVDDEKKIYWYHPAWRDRQKNPRSIPIQKAAQTVELPEAVSHQLTGKTLKIYAIFTDVPWTVTEMEELIRKHPDRIEMPNAIQESLQVRIK